MMSFIQYRILPLCIFVASCLGADAQSLRFDEKRIASEPFESANVFDVDRDGSLDIFSGSFWYPGPEFQSRRYVGPIKRFNEYFDDFSAIVMDVNQDGREDVITGGWFEGRLVWKENPGGNESWKEHLIAHCGNIESTRAWDIDGDGTLEIVPNTPGRPLVIYRLRQEGGKPVFDSIPILEKHGHGLGFGDINGDGRGDLVVAEGWLASPAQPFKEPWKFNDTFTFKQASVPMIVVDVNSDGRSDLIVGQGHDYGLAWYEQPPSGPSDKNWKKHPIDSDNAQFHTMEWEDIDQHAKPELITGKRYRAHDDNDPGAHDPVGLYYYKWTAEGFKKNVIRYGPLGTGKGTGIYFSVRDLNGDGWKDITVAGKDGLTVFFNKGFSGH
jgi:hypothetical protein